MLYCWVLRTDSNAPMTDQIGTANHLDRADVDAIAKELLAIRADMVAAAALTKRWLDAVHENYRDSGRNLLHYLALRRHDLRPLQLRLAQWGLSSLGRAESHVLATVDAVLNALRALCDGDWHLPHEEAAVVDFANGERLLVKHTEALLGSVGPGRDVRIMVTMPSEAADDYDLVRDLLQEGMDCMRINCAHDDAARWLRMIEHLRRAETSVGRRCRVVMDLAGPKLRTGPLQAKPGVVRIRPQRDIYGRVAAPARIWLTAEPTPQAPPSPADACLPVPGAWLADLQQGDCVRFTDARQAERSFTIVEVAAGGCWAEATKSAYVMSGTMLRRSNAKKSKHVEAPIGTVPTQQEPILLHRGDLLVLTRDLDVGRRATKQNDVPYVTPAPAKIGCTLPEVFEDVRVGESIWFDDGKIGGVIEAIEQTRVHVRITHARLRGDNLRSDKGINLPDSNLRLDALTHKDLDDLAFVAQHADVVELSFANTVKDVESLQSHLARMGVRQPAIVLKIETRRGFENLPEMLLAAMRAPSCGVMIARGDLAVECGFERLAEVQEEILWICEAAHVPVIWATQVLETLARNDMPSRAEITDAAMGQRAECVMLNKGPHVIHAIRVLDDILRRMQAHQAKKSGMLRRLQVAHSPLLLASLPVG
jgi:pyruvate kinase